MTFFHELVQFHRPDRHVYALAYASRVLMGVLDSLRSRADPVRVFAEPLQVAGLCGPGVLSGCVFPGLLRSIQYEVWKTVEMTIDAEARGRRALMVAVRV